jgi:hypothetical protein
MQFDALLKSNLKDQIGQTADRLKAWEKQSGLTEKQKEEIAKRIRFFDHTTHSPTKNRIGGVDGSGDFPVLSFEGAFIHFAIAQATQYRPGRDSPVEVGPEMAPVAYLAWLPESEGQRKKELDRAFTALSGRTIEDVIRQSDYQELKKRYAGRSNLLSTLKRKLLRPQASDSGNLSIQLRSTAELGAALALIRRSETGDTVLIDSTLSLPFVSQSPVSLFHEHLKRLCCVEARERGIQFVALSKSHGLPAMEDIENVARTLSEEDGEVEHWFLRLPIPDRDEWDFGSIEGRLVPPPGAVTYLVRFHASVPVMRVDLDRSFWKSDLHEGGEKKTAANEQRLFERLDYMSHDMRAYGYPYPLKAAHDRASLAEKERKMFRSQLVDEAVRRGISRKRLRDASILTSHA